MGSRETLRIGHRGAAGTAPENTLASFRKALALGVDAVECDVHRTSDGALVVIHDDTLDRTTNGTGPVAARTLAEIRRLDAGSWKGSEFAGERVPTLDELVEAVPPPTGIVIELKATLESREIEVDVARFLRERPSLTGRVTVIAFDHRALARFHAELPAIPTAALYVALPVDPVGLARSCGASALMPNFRYLTREMVDEAHRAGLRVYTWTVNRPEDIAAVRALGVDGIGSDHPDRLSA